VKRTVVFDSGAVIAAERNDRRIWAILAAAEASRSAVMLPATVIAETWRGTKTLAGGGSITDANVVDVAIHAAPAVVVTSDPHDIRALLKSSASSADVQIRGL
jgi:hypothetical protein